MKYILLIFTVVLGGCYQTVNSFDIYKATNACGGIENVVEIQSSAIGSEVVLCKNNKWINLQ